MYRYLFCCRSVNPFLRKALFFCCDSLRYFWRPTGKLAGTRWEFATNAVLAAGLGCQMRFVKISAILSSVMCSQFFSTGFTVKVPGECRKCSRVVSQMLQRRCYEKNWLHISEDNDHSYQRVLIRAKPHSSLGFLFSLAMDSVLTK